jgi:hypothetical protein
MDNLSAHDTDEVLDWFDAHPRWIRHFTPKPASWLNQIECAFSIFRARVLARGSFASTDLWEKVYAYMAWHNNATEQPFHWTYRPSPGTRNLAGLLADGTRAFFRCLERNGLRRALRARKTL